MLLCFPRTGSGVSAERRAGTLIVNWKGRRTVITGWRAWLIVSSAVLLGARIAVAVIGLFFGVVLTLGLVLVIAVPLAIILDLIAKLALPKTPEGDAGAFGNPLPISAESAHPPIAAI